MSSLFGVAPSNHTAWRPEPTFRGTASMLSTCLTTMILCVWTAVHLNIPEPGKKKGILTPQNGRKIVFLLTGLFAPELIAWVAFEQRKAASRFSNFMRKRLGQQTIRSFWTDMMRTRRQEPFELVHISPQLHQEWISPQPRHEWTLTHSFYAIMGGFVIDLSKERIELLADKKHTRLTLNISALLWVAEWGPDVIPDLAEGEIQDKSKANGLAKTLVFLQAIWFCVQCINRLVQGLAISLLELNTFAHALCTLVIYVLWWNKPLDIEEPTPFQGPRARGATALVLSDSLSTSSRFLRFAQAGQKDKRTIDMSYSGTESRTSPGSLRNSLQPQADSTTNERSQPGNVIHGPTQDRLKPEYDYTSLELENDKSEPEEKTARATESDSSRPEYENSRPEAENPEAGAKPDSPGPENGVAEYEDRQLCHNQFVRIHDGRDLHGVTLKVRTYRLSGSTSDPETLSYVDLSHTEFESLDLAAQEMKYRGLSGPKGITLALHAKNLPPYFWGNENKSISIYASLVLASLSYGAIHMAAWNAPFPSHIQQLLWRVSSTSLAGFGILCLCPLVVEYVAAKMELETTWRNESKRRRIKEVISRFVAFMYLLYRLAGFLLCALYFFGRIYLFVECFITIPNLPDSVYEVPAWSRYFPHIS